MGPGTADKTTSRGHHCMQLLFDLHLLQLSVSQKVMVNYNSDVPKERGFWYDGIITRKASCYSYRILEASCYSYRILEASCYSYRILEESCRHEAITCGLCHGLTHMIFILFPGR